MQFSQFVTQIASELDRDELAALITDDALAARLPADRLGRLLHTGELADRLDETQVITLVSVAEAQHVIRAQLGRSASGWLAEAAGISPRTARRWLSASVPRARQAAVTNYALDADPSGLRALAAEQADDDVLATVAARLDADERTAVAARADVDTRAAVAGQTIPHPTRAAAAMQGCAGQVSVGWVAVRYDTKPQGKRHIPPVTIDLAPIIAALQAGRLEDAADEFSYAILEGYEPGLGGVLEITDYLDGITLH